MARRRRPIAIHCNTLLQAISTQNTATTARVQRTPIGATEYSGRYLTSCIRSASRHSPRRAGPSVSALDSVAVREPGGCTGTAGCRVRLGRSRRA